MEDETSYTLAADTESEINDWLTALQRVIQSNEQGSIDKYKGEYTWFNINGVDLNRESPLQSNVAHIIAL